MPAPPAVAPKTSDDTRPAAQYVRMSTHNQKFSILHQESVIRRYANVHGFVIIRSYADVGKSGLHISGRSALRQLISDITSGVAQFETVLVYDVSRWGRFQDADESAYYEYVCKKAGVSVRYCAEQFDHYDSMVATILKSMKRAMAGEYSRELSVRIHASQSHFAGLGFHQGGVPALGLRRMRVDKFGNRKELLGPGDRKCLKTDRVILVPGPAKERKIVEQIFKLLVEDGLSVSKIARVLTAEGVPSYHGNPWQASAIRKILANEKYIGNFVYNKRSFKLRTERVTNSPDKWVRAIDAFEPIISKELFYAAQAIAKARTINQSDEQLLRRLKRLYRKHGRLTTYLIDKDEITPSASAYVSRFGSLVEAYARIGYWPAGRRGPDKEIN